MRITLVMKITAAIVMLIALGLGLISYLGYAKFVKVYRQIEESRYAAVLVELKSGIELTLTLGLPLTQLPNLGKVLIDGKQSAAGIDDLDVTTPDGMILFSAGGSGSGARVPVGWLTAAAIEPDEPLRRFSDGSLSGLSAPIGDSFGRQVGTMVLTYEQAGSDAVMGEVFGRLTRLFGLVFVAFAGIAGVAVWICFRPVGRSFARMTELLGTADTAPPVATPTANDLEHQVVAFHRITETVRTTLRKAFERFPAPEAWSLSALQNDADLNTRLASHGIITDHLYADPDFVALIKRSFRRFAEVNGDNRAVPWPTPAPPLVRALTDPAVRERLLDHGLDADDLLDDPAFAALAAGLPDPAAGSPKRSAA